MAKMTSRMDGSREQDEDPAQGEREDERSPSARAAAGASVLASQQVQKARERVDEQISAQRDRVTGRVRTLSRALKGAGGMLEEDDVVAQCLHFAGEKVEGVAGYVDALTTDRVAEDLRGVARDRPAWFFGGAFVLGLALGRFARSTAGNLTQNPSNQGRARRVSASRTPLERARPSTRINAPAGRTGAEGRVSASGQPRGGAPRP